MAEALVARGAPAIERTRAQSEAKGRAEGEAKGHADGEARGRVEAKAMAVLAVLTARGIELAQELRARVLDCFDSATLDRWLARAAVATSHEQVFGEP